MKRIIAAILAIALQISILSNRSLSDKAWWSILFLGSIGIVTVWLYFTEE